MHGISVLPSCNSVTSCSFHSNLWLYPSANDLNAPVFTCPKLVANYPISSHNLEVWQALYGNSRHWQPSKCIDCHHHRTDPCFALNHRDCAWRTEQTSNSTRLNKPFRNFRFVMSWCSQKDFRVAKRVYLHKTKTRSNLSTATANANLRFC